jgi:hypothetical protein
MPWITAWRRWPAAALTSINRPMGGPTCLAGVGLMAPRQAVLPSWFVCGTGAGVTIQCTVAYARGCPQNPSIPAEARRGTQHYYGRRRVGRQQSEGLPGKGARSRASIAERTRRRYQP